MSQPSWGSAPTDPALSEDQFQQLCDEACATMQQLSRAELQNLIDDSDAFNHVVSDLEKVTFHVYCDTTINSNSNCFVSGALSLLVWQPEGHPACKKLLYKSHTFNFWRPVQTSSHCGVLGSVKQNLKGVYATVVSLNRVATNLENMEYSDLSVHGQLMRFSGNSVQPHR